MTDAHLERLTSDDVGLPTGTRVPLSFTPGAYWTPLVVSCPHVGLAWPAELRPKPQADFARNADFEVHTLYNGIEALGVATVRAHYSRLVVDLNRAEDDVSHQLVPDHPAPRPRVLPGIAGSETPRAWDRPGRGVVWASAVTAGVGTTRILTPPLAYSAFADRIAYYHRPYYQALEVLLRRRRERFGYAVLLDAHSMPSSVGVDIVVGTLDYLSCGERVADLAYQALGRREYGETLSVRRDDPYRGGEIVRYFGRPCEHFYAIQLEVSRRLYMDERSSRVFAWPAGVPRLSSPEVDPVGTSLPPNRRRARELCELISRVRTLVESLAQSRSDLAQPRDRSTPIT